MVVIVPGYRLHGIGGTRKNHQRMVMMLIMLMMMIMIDDDGNYDNDDDDDHHHSQSINQSIVFCYRALVPFQNFIIFLLHYR